MGKLLVLALLVFGMASVRADAPVAVRGKLQVRISPWKAACPTTTEGEPARCGLPMADTEKAVELELTLAEVNAPGQAMPVSSKWEATSSSDGKRIRGELTVYSIYPHVIS